MKGNPLLGKYDICQQFFPAIYQRRQSQCQGLHISIFFHLLPEPRFLAVSELYLPRLSNQPLTNSVVETQLKLASTLPPCMYNRTLHYLPSAPVSQQCGDYGETQTGEFLNYSDYDGRAMICFTNGFIFKLNASLKGND